MTSTEALRNTLFLWDSGPYDHGSEKTGLDGLLEMVEPFRDGPREAIREILAESLREATEAMLMEGFMEVNDPAQALRLEVLAAVDYREFTEWLLAAARLREKQPAAYTGLRELLATSDMERAERVFRLARTA